MILRQFDFVITYMKIIEEKLDFALLELAVIDVCHGWFLMAFNY